MQDVDLVLYNIMKLSSTESVPFVLGLPQAKKTAFSSNLNKKAQILWNFGSHAFYSESKLQWPHLEFDTTQSSSWAFQLSIRDMLLIPNRSQIYSEAAYLVAKTLPHSRVVSFLGWFGMGLELGGVWVTPT